MQLDEDFITNRFGLCSFVFFLTHKRTVRKLAIQHFRRSAFGYSGDLKLRLFRRPHDP